MVRFKLIFALFILFILFTSCNYSYNFSTSNKNSKNPVNVSILKTEKGYEYYIGNELVNEFTNENCDEKEMDLLKYIYDTSKEELDNKPKEERTKPKKKMLVYK